MMLPGVVLFIPNFILIRDLGWLNSMAGMVAPFALMSGFSIFFLRQFFLAYLNSGRAYVAMPSQVADDLWHEFILYTRAYQAFCKEAFGGFLHHTPAVALAQGRKRDNAGLRRVWLQCCRLDGINPVKPTRLPLLFALDTKLNIPGGYRYEPDCAQLRRHGDAGTQCGGDFSSSSYDGGTDGMGDGGRSDSGSSDGGGDGGSCGGGGGD